MNLARAFRDERGTTTIEFGLSAPIFFMLLFGSIMGGLLLWTQLGLQHGAEMAARCAVIDKILCGSVSAIREYASKQTFGLNPAPSIFTVSDQACGIQVSASYAFPHVTSYFGDAAITVNAQSCFPK